MTYVSVSYAIDGGPADARIRTSRLADGQDVTGTKIRLYVDPANPRNFQPELNRSDAMLYSGFALSGVLIGAAGLWLLRLQRRAAEATSDRLNRKYC